MNKYMKSFIGLGIVAAAVTAFLAWPSDTTDATLNVADGNASDNVEGDAIRASFNDEVPLNDDQKTPASTTNQDIIDRTNEAAKRSEDADALEVEVIADDN